jgi:hypothetical protein
VICNETRSDSTEKFEKALYIFFLKYFNELDKIKVKSFLCNNLNYQVPFNISYKVMNTQSILNLKSSIERFQLKLSNESSKVELTKELESIALSVSDLRLTVNIDAWSGGFDNQAIEPEICPRISCFNDKYFKLNCNSASKDQIFCEHICDFNMPCENSGRCIPLFDKNFEPQCM